MSKAAKKKRGASYRKLEIDGNLIWVFPLSRIPMWAIRLSETRRGVDLLRATYNERRPYIGLNIRKDQKDFERPLGSSKRGSE